MILALVFHSVSLCGLVVESPFGKPGEDGGDDTEEEPDVVDEDVVEGNPRPSKRQKTSVSDLLTHICFLFTTC